MPYVLGFDREIHSAATSFGLAPDLVSAVVLTESSGRPYAYRFEPDFWRRYLQGKPEWADRLPARVSASYGLMQIMYPVAYELGFGDDPEMLFVPRVNLFWGCRYLSDLIAWAGGDVDKALASYNGGKGAGLRAPDYPEAQRIYIRKVRGHLEAVSA